jgi:hypothetical protein
MGQIGFPARNIIKGPLVAGSKALPTVKPSIRIACFEKETLPVGAWQGSVPISIAQLAKEAHS